MFTADLEAEGDVIATQYLGADNCVCAAFSKGDLIVRMLDTEEVHIILVLDVPFIPRTIFNFIYFFLLWTKTRKAEQVQENFMVTEGVLRFTVALATREDVHRMHTSVMRPCSDTLSYLSSPPPSLPLPPSFLSALVVCDIVTWGSSSGTDGMRWLFRRWHFSNGLVP